MNTQSGSDTRAVADTLATKKHEDVVSALINTYRELNMSVRRAPADKIETGGGEGSIHSIMVRMRLDEMNFAQALKQRVTGVVISASEDDERLNPKAHADHSTMMLISQFGSARETTLSLLRDMPDETWEAKIDDGSTILDHIQELIKNDQAQMQRIKQLLA